MAKYLSTYLLIASSLLGRVIIWSEGQHFSRARGRLTTDHCLTYFACQPDHSNRQGSQVSLTSKVMFHTLSKKELNWKLQWVHNDNAWCNGLSLVLLLRSSLYNPETTFFFIVLLLRSSLYHPDSTEIIFAHRLGRPEGKANADSFVVRYASARCLRIYVISKRHK